MFRSTFGLLRKGLVLPSKNKHKPFCILAWMFYFIIALYVYLFMLFLLSLRQSYLVSLLVPGRRAQDLTILLVLGLR